MEHWRTMRGPVQTNKGDTRGLSSDILGHQQWQGKVTQGKVTQTGSHHTAPAVYTTARRSPAQPSGGRGRRESNCHRQPSAASCPLGPACSSPGLAAPLLASTSARGPRLHQGDGGRPCRPGERVGPPRAVSGPLRSSHRGGVWQPPRWRALHAHCYTTQIGNRSAL